MGKQARQQTQREKHLQEGYEAGFEDGVEAGARMAAMGTVFDGFSPWQLALAYNTSVPGTKSQLSQLMRQFNSGLYVVVRSYHSPSEPQD